MNCYRDNLVTVLLITLVVLFCVESSTVVAEDDVECLRGVERSLGGPGSEISTWNFSNTTRGFICGFSGVTCWNDQENRILSLTLRDLGLAGSIPSELQICQSLTNLDLSGNNITGSIPSEICSWLPYLVSLDLSNNEFTGEIPANLGNCSFLNTILLSGNKLSGNIPVQFSNLGRLNRFSVANNGLSGSIPSGLSNFDSSNFDGNDGLCGKPLTKCGGLSEKNLAIIIVAGVLGAVGSILLGFGLWWCCSTRSKRKRRNGIDRDDDSSSWADGLRAFKLVQVSLFQKPLVKVKLVDLMIATNNFSRENVIISTKTSSLRSLLQRRSIDLQLRPAETPPQRPATPFHPRVQPPVASPSHPLRSQVTPPLPVHFAVNTTPLPFPFLDDHIVSPAPTVSLSPPPLGY